MYICMYVCIYVCMYVLASNCNFVQLTPIKSWLGNRMHYNQVPRILV